MVQAKLKDIVSIDKCKVRGFLEGVNLKSLKNKHYELSIVIKNFIRDFDIKNGDLTTIPASLEKLVDESMFVSKDEKIAEIELLTKQLVRYFEYEQLFNRKVLMKNITKAVQYQGNEITVSADIIFENKGTIEVVKYKKGEPKLSYRGQKYETNPKYSIELYMLQKLGEELYKDKPVTASYYHLQSKGDNSREFQELFEFKKGYNIINYHFVNEVDEDEAYIKYIDNKIFEILNRKLSFNSEKTCDESNCEKCSFSKICYYEEKTETELDIVEVIEKSPNGTIHLTEDQKKAVQFDCGIVRINAGAGAGKTSVLALRVVNLFKKGTKPENILLITFSNKGAVEIKEKVSYWLKHFKLEHIDVDKMNIFTFNSFGERIISEEFEKLGFESKPLLAEKVERYDIIFQLLESYPKIQGLDYKNPLMNLPYAKGAVVLVDSYFDKIKANNYLNYEEFAKDVNCTVIVAEGVWNLYQIFNEDLIENSLLQYQDQINYTLQIFRAYPETLRKYTVEHIMVDEFQDTDYNQLQIITLLVKQGKFQSLMVVGDDSQSIFSFRNVSQEFILNFNEFFKSAKDINLVDNFRSTPEIIRTANLLNQKNKNRVDKDLISRKASGKLPKLIHYFEKKEEYENIAEIVKEKLDQGVKAEEIAIIARTKKELLEIKNIFDAKNIPAVMDVTQLLLNNKNIQVILSFANFLNNPELELNLLEYLLMFKNDTIKEMSSLELKDFVGHYRNNFVKTFYALTTDAQKIEFFFKTIASIATKDKAVAEFTKVLRDKEFKSFDSLINYLIKFALYKDEKTLEVNNIKFKAVVLTTAHSSKGKEFDVVINTINKYKYTGTQIRDKERDEERRLLFVSITRAKSELYITYSSYGGGRKVNSCMGFVTELEGIQRIDYVKQTA
ncbi:MAG: ATP-dependent helicase UvrD/REP family [Clostridiaceae bacterium]|nr:ATP-dependent helicase UvrD/REP family [Clostridiaceae bacterium]